MSHKATGEVIQWPRTTVSENQLGNANPASLCENAAFSLHQKIARSDM